MAHVAATAIAAQAEKHEGESGPTNTCMSNGLEKWTAEVGVKGLDTASVSEGVARAKQGYNGWKYVEGTHGIARGHFGVWANIGHVTCVTDVRGALWHGIGSGTPSQKVAIQPASGGYNPMNVLQGYLVAPTETGEVAKPAVAKPAAKPAQSGDIYTVRKGDTLIRIAGKHGTTWQKIRAANSAKGDASSDFHILRPNLIVVGQKLHIP